jgi:DNA-binding CsgD family transcriptional regulator
MLLEWQSASVGSPNGNPEEEVAMIATEKDDREYREILHLGQAGLDPEALAPRLAARLSRAVPFDGYALVTIDPLTGLATDFVFSDTLGTGEDARFFIENIYFEDDVLDYGWMARERIPAMTLSEATGGKPERALRYREYNAPKGFGPGARAVLTAAGRPWGGLCLVRGKDARDFSTREVDFLRRISPHLGAALRAAALRREPLSGLDAEPAADGEEPDARFVADTGFAPDAAGVLTLDRAGRVKQQTAAAERLLRELEDGNGNGKVKDLPKAVCSAVGALRRTVGTGDSERVPFLHARGRSGRWLTLQASFSRPVTGGPAETVVVIAPAGPGELARLRTVAYGLSAREKEVVGYVLRGCSTRQISRSLYISESTVQGHLAHVFEKVGVKSRRELVKRLFLDNFSPPMSA